MNSENPLCILGTLNALSSFSCHHWKIHALNWKPSVLLLHLRLHPGTTERTELGQFFSTQHFSWWFSRREGETKNMESFRPKWSGQRHFFIKKHFESFPKWSKLKPPDRDKKKAIYPRLVWSDFLSLWNVLNFFSESPEHSYKFERTLKIVKSLFLFSVCEGANPS